MKKSIVEKFADFKRRNLLSNEIIAKMITEYANSDTDLARTHFSEKYKISVATFYKARDFAIICCLVDGNTAKRAVAKLAKNCRNNNPEKSGRKSLAHSQELYEERQKFLDSFTDNDIRDIAYKYADGCSTHIIAVAYDTGEYAIKLLLKKGIEELIVDADTTKAISKKLGESLNRILQVREDNKKVVLDCINMEIESLNMQIEYYPLYSKLVNGVPDLVSLKRTLSTAIKRKEEVLRL